MCKPHLVIESLLRAFANSMRSFFKASASVLASARFAGSPLCRFCDHHAVENASAAVSAVKLAVCLSASPARPPENVAAFATEANRKPNPNAHSITSPVNFHG